MSEEYTPSMVEVRADYAKSASEDIVLYRVGILGDRPYEPEKGEYVTHYLSKQIIPGERAKAHAEFDRMIAEVERAAKEQAWFEGLRCGLNWRPTGESDTTNPYRKAPDGS
jgi:hypothetical protein